MGLFFSDRVHISCFSRAGLAAMCLQQQMRPDQSETGKF
jgi:hypothetical protein